jgi:hypothetical protein
VGQDLLIIKAPRSHLIRHTTLGKTPLNELPARRRDLYLTTHNTQKRQIFMSPAGFKPAVPGSERPQANAVDRAATGMCLLFVYLSLFSQVIFLVLPVLLRVHPIATFDLMNLVILRVIIAEVPYIHRKYNDILSATLVWYTFCQMWQGDHNWWLGKDFEHVGLAYFKVTNYHLRGRKKIFRKLSVRIASLNRLSPDKIYNLTFIICISTK